MTFTSILIQGNIISTEVLDKIRTEDIRFQTPKDFRLAPNTTVRDEISIAWSLATSHWEVFKKKREQLVETDSGTSETRKYWMLPLMSLLGYELGSATAELINGKSYAISHRATNLDNFPVHIIGVQQSLDKRADTGGPRLSPHALAQEYLNNQEHLYALVSNGKFLRLLRDATRLSRLSYLEFNLEQIMEEQLYTEFALLFRLLHASRMPQQMDAGPDSYLEYYHLEALAHGGRIREKLSLAVETSIKEIANSFLQHKANENLQEAVATNTINAKDYYIYNLRVIYRLLFLMVIEERKLVYPETRNTQLEAKRKIYYDHYSVRRICSLAGKRVFVEPEKCDLWLSLQTCFSLYEQDRYGRALGIAPLGSGLFAPDALGILTGQMLSNQHLLSVLRHLTNFVNESGQLVRVNYADLDVEEFGSVYEGLLEYEPEFSGGMFIFKQGTDRSKSGSHYTPEELVKPLIQHSLEHQIQDKLKMPNPEAALLSLKVCDVACGSGHILLSAARRIGFELARLRSGEDQPSPTVQRHAIGDAIRHCIYGVDKNPLAVELCKVAMWLEAHEPGQPLNFLDHHIKCGDAIVGLGLREELENGIANEAFKTLSADDKDIAAGLLKRNKQERKRMESAHAAQQLTTDVQVDTTLQETMAAYKTFSHLPETTPEEIDRKAKAYKKFVDSKGFTFLKTMADLQVAQFFIPKTESNKRVLITDADYRLILSGYKGWQIPATAKAAAVAHEERFFHWFIEFPEVFNEGGFDCILGNPPFLGGQKLSGNFGDPFLEFIKHQFTPIGAVDLVTYFFRRIFSIIKKEGFQSLISTNTIAQGKAREGGLDFIVNNGGTINHAIRSMRWPGVAAVEVSLVTITKRRWDKKYFLDNKAVQTITPYLDDSLVIGNPFPLKQNVKKSFMGSVVLGKGFVITPEEAETLIKKDPRNKEVLFPYLNGDDLNNSPDQNASRWVINFFDWSEGKAQSYPACFEIIERLVKPERQRPNNKMGREKWWQFYRRGVDLYETISQLDQVMAVALTSKTVAITLLPSNQVFSHSLGLFAYNDFAAFCILQSTIHNIWAWLYGSSMKSDLRYTPSVCFETFPFPLNVSDEQIEQMILIGNKYYETRQVLMKESQIGLTKVYNLFHGEKIKKTDEEKNSLTDNAFLKEFGKEAISLKRHLHLIEGITYNETIEQIKLLRSLHIRMDAVVLSAYGWDDIELKHDFYELDYLPEGDKVRYTIHPLTRKEILKRLLALNHQLHALTIESSKPILAKTDLQEGNSPFTLF
ncbi:Eco57I restriction-modification methylase domain-containing protein [Pedobacter hartonius]|uniref:site-specific DNA-methyltransferase (adenine-specific) n=1 Tax=Pedobacter hartonius TaxID=425514 RepID=A0A1H4F4U9_9SPHI|nr:DNA methyltransferase [Pedobacter hartonius]SEA92269.1 Type II restriction/modification system, DNA methylase subunit YeeA [Pedobacter hartonius]